MNSGKTLATGATKESGGVIIQTIRVNTKCTKYNNSNNT